MVLNARNTRSIHRTTYCGQTATVKLLKRDDNQRQGTVRELTLFRVMRFGITVTGETIQADMNSDVRAKFLIPKAELMRVGVDYINPTDRLVDSKGRHWQPESTTSISVDLFENEIGVECLRIDPPKQ